MTIMCVPLALATHLIVEWGGLIVAMLSQVHVKYVYTLCPKSHLNK